MCKILKKNDTQWFTLYQKMSCVIVKPQVEH